MNYQEIKSNLINMSRNVWLASLGSIVTFSRETQGTVKNVLNMNVNEVKETKTYQNLTNYVTKARDKGNDFFNSIKLQLKNLSLQTSS